MIRNIAFKSRNTGNLNKQFDTEESAPWATPRRGSLLLEEPETKKAAAAPKIDRSMFAAFLVVTACLALMCDIHAEGADQQSDWYLTRNCANNFYGAATNMMYWANGSVDGENGGSTIGLNEGVCYFVNGGRNFTTLNQNGFLFPGATLTIGDDETAGGMYLRAKGQTFRNLILNKGTIWHTVSRSATASQVVHLYANMLGSATVHASKSSPFVINSSYNKLWMGWYGKLIGDENAALSIGSPAGRCSNVLVSITNAAAYYGDIVVTSNFVNAEREFGSGLGVDGPIPGTVRIKGGSIIKPHAPTSVADLGELHMDEGTEMRFVYDSASMTGGLIRVSNALTLPDKVVVHAMTGIEDDKWVPPASITGEEVRSPFLVGPPGVRIDPAIFEFVPDPACEPQLNSDIRPQRVHFETDTDPVSSRDTVYAVIEPIITTVKGQPANAYTVAAARAEGSALTNGTFWSDGRVPHANAHYVVNSSILSLVEDNVEYVFPGKSLLLYNGRFHLYGSNARISISDFRMASAVNQWRSGGVTICGGQMHLYGMQSYMSATLGKTLTIDSEIVGEGDLTLKGWGGDNTTSTHGFFALRGFNTNWHGRIDVIAPENLRVDDWDVDYLTIRLYDGRNLGGRLEEFDYGALNLGRLCELYAHTNVTLDAAVNRGIFLSHEQGARIAVDEGYTLDCHWPITLNGPLYKTSGGTLALGGGVKFYEVVGTVANITDDLPEDPSKRLLVVTNGTLKALTHDCVNGLTIALANNANTSLALDFIEEEGDLKRYGFYNVKTDAPFEVGKPINIQLNGVDGAKLKEWKRYKQGLVTVKTSVAESLRLDDLISFRKTFASGRPNVRLVREDDSETGLTTYSAYYKFVGAEIIVR